MKIQDLKPGDVVWECEHGMNARLTIVAQPERFDIPYVAGESVEQIGWGVVAKTDSGHEVFLYCADKGGAYGPHLYSTPQYA